MQRYGSENEHADDYHDQSGMPIVPKRRHRSTVERDLLEHKQHDVSLVVKCSNIVWATKNHKVIAMIFSGRIS